MAMARVVSVEQWEQEPDWSGLKGKWEVRKWNYFEELDCVEKKRKKATDRGCMSGILLLLKEIWIYLNNRKMDPEGETGYTRESLDKLQIRFRKAGGG